MKLSIVATLYKSASFVDEFYERSVKAAENLFGDDFEIILVNDGSPDDSLAPTVALHEQDRCVKVLDLSRNFGHHKAMMAGLSYASGDYIFLLDSDLEEQPEWLASFYQELTEAEGVETVDVVFGVQQKRKGKWFERVSGALFSNSSAICPKRKFPKI